MKEDNNSQLSIINSQFKMTEVGMIPKDWHVMLIGDISKVKTGPFGTALHEKDYVDSGTPVLTVEHLGERGVTYQNLPLVSDADRLRLKAYSLRRNDIVFSRVGSVDRNALISVTEEGWLFSGRLLRVRPDRDQVHAPYLSHHFHSENFKQRVRDVAVGQTMASLNTQILRNVNAVLPETKAEQEAIAEALSDADALIESLEQLIAKKRHLKQGAMQELLTGKKRLPGFEVKPGYKQTEVGVIPEDWHPTTIGDLAIKVGSGITPKGGRSKYKEYGRPFIRSQNVGWGTLLLSELAYINDDTHKTFSATELRQDDVLLNITGASIGRSAIADDRLEGGNVNQHVCIIRTDPDEVASPFINCFLLSRLGQRQIDSFQAGGNREGLNFGQIRSIKLPLPTTKTEQTAIAAILSDMDAEIAALETKLAKAHQLKQGMMQELLTGKIRLIN